MSVLKKFAGQTLIYGLSSIVGRLLNYLLVPFFTRIFVGDLGKAEYGISNEFFAYASFGAVFFTYGMETAFFRFIQKNEEKDSVFSTALKGITVSSVVFAVLFILFSTPFCRLTQNIGREPFVVCLALILAFDAVSALLFAKLRQENKAMRFATIRFVSIGVNIALNLFFYGLVPLLTSFGLFAPLSAHEPSAYWMFLANVAASGVVFLFFRKELLALRAPFNMPLFKKMLRYGLPVLLMGLAGMTNETLDRILIKQLSPSGGDVLNGIYSANYKLSIIITLFIQAFRMGAEPFFFANAQEDNAAETHARIMKYFMMVCATIFLGVLLYLDIFKYFIGEEYWEGLHVVPILLMANVCLGAYYNLSVWYKLTDKTNLGARVSLLGAAITLVLNFLWIPIFSYTGSAWATLICYFTMSVVSYFLGQKHYPIPYPTRRILAYLALALSFYFTSEILRDLHFFESIWASLALNSLLFAAFLFIIFKLEEKEFRLLLEKVSP
jgi:O-antigen/teichoic acid export membrane protein